MPREKQPQHTEISPSDGLWLTSFTFTFPYPSICGAERLLLLQVHAGCILHVSQYGSRVCLLCVRLIGSAPEPSEDETNMKKKLRYDTKHEVILSTIDHRDLCCNARALVPHGMFNGFAVPALNGISFSSTESSRACPTTHQCIVIQVEANLPLPDEHKPLVFVHFLRIPILRKHHHQ